MGGDVVTEGEERGDRVRLHICMYFFVFEGTFFGAEDAG